MRYYHRTSLDIDTVLLEADSYFGSRLSAGDPGERTRTFTGTLGERTVRVRAEGGHYTNIDISTDQAGESETLAAVADDDESDAGEPSDGKGATQ